MGPRRHTCDCTAEMELGKSNAEAASRQGEPSEVSANMHGIQWHRCDIHRVDPCMHMQAKKEKRLTKKTEEEAKEKACASPKKSVEELSHTRPEPAYKLSRKPWKVDRTCLSAGTCVDEDGLISETRECNEGTFKRRRVDRSGEESDSSERFDIPEHDDERMRTRSQRSEGRSSMHCNAGVDYAPRERAAMAKEDYRYKAADETGNKAKQSPDAGCEVPRCTRKDLKAKMRHEVACKKSKASKSRHLGGEAQTGGGESSRKRARKGDRLTGEATEKMASEHAKPLQRIKRKTTCTEMLQGKAARVKAGEAIGGVPMSRTPFDGCDLSVSFAAHPPEADVTLTREQLRKKLMSRISAAPCEEPRYSPPAKRRYVGDGTAPSYRPSSLE